MFFPLNSRSPEVNKGKHLVETWGKVPVTSGYTDYAKIGENLVPKLLANFFPSTVVMTKISKLTSFRLTSIEL